MGNKTIKCREGLWFAVPLRSGGYAPGILVSGGRSVKSGLGYFFGPRYDQIPNDEETWKKKPEEALLVVKFGCLGIINGSWPIIKSTRPFLKEEWPLPKFGLTDPLFPHKAFVREYQEDSSGRLQLARQTVVDANEAAGLPEDGLFGGGVVEIRLAELLSDFRWSPSPAAPRDSASAGR